MSQQLQIWERLPDEEIVVKANELITSQLNWTTREYRVFIAHVSQLNRDDKDFDEVSIRLQELCEISDTNTESLYSEMDQIADRLTDKKINVGKGIEGRQTGGYVNVYSSCTYDASTGEITGEFTEKMRPLLLQLKEHFTMYYRRHALAMRSTYSMRFYEILKRYEYQGRFQLSVEELRTIFGLEDKYSRFGDLKRNVIDRAQEELDEKGDVTFEYQVLREGRSPVAIDFSIENVHDEEIEDPPDLDLESPSESQEQEDDRLQKFDTLPEKIQQDIKQKALRKAKHNNPDGGKMLIESQMWMYAIKIAREKGHMD
jgi:plasmid replication initiation protein